MAIHTVVTCDHCNTTTDDEQGLNYHLEFQRSGTRYDLDFCTLVCMGSWLVKQWDQAKWGTDVRLFTTSRSGTDLLCLLKNREE